MDFSFFLKPVNFFYLEHFRFVLTSMSLFVVLLRCYRIVPKPAGKWSFTGGHHLVTTLCVSSMFMRTSIRAKSVCLSLWNGEYTVLGCPPPTH